MIFFLKALLIISSITCHSFKISNTELLERSDMSDIKLTIKQMKWRWLVHTLRKGQGDITNQSLKWNPQDNQKVAFGSLNSCCLQRKMERPCAWPTLYL